MRTERRSAAAGMALVALLGAVAGCTGSGTPAPAPSPTGAGTELPVTDPDAEALAALVVELGDTVTALRAELEDAAAGDEAALQRAAELLVADVESALSEDAAMAGGDADVDEDDPTGAATASAGSEVDVDAGPPPLLPGPRSSREESIQYGDLLTRTLAAARGAGSDGEPILRFLADPLAGDLGSWQRAPDDQLAAIARTGTQGDLAATEQAVLDLAGEAPRALAWVVHGLDQPDDAAESAGRALAHLTVIDLALDQLG